MLTLSISLARERERLMILVSFHFVFVAAFLFSYFCSRRVFTFPFHDSQLADMLCVVFFSRGLRQNMRTRRRVVCS